MEALRKEKQKQKRNKLLQPNSFVTDNYLCVKDDGSLIKPYYASQHFQLLLKKNNLEKIRFHDLCHSVATYLFSLGYRMKEISEFLGHMLCRITEKYIDSALK